MNTEQNTTSSPHDAKRMLCGRAFIKRIKIIIMFWKRKEKITHTAKGHIFIPPPPPPKKDFETMLELLRDAEKFDNAGEKDVSNATLKNLCEFIEQYVARSS